MKIISLTRKPCRGSSTTGNVVEHHAGALNIDSCRTGGGQGGTREGEESRNRRYTSRGSTNFAPTPGPRGGDARGRWPANIMLQHRADCRQTGTKTVPGYTINRWSDGAKPFGGGAGHSYESQEQPEETIALWECTENCAAEILAVQSGASQSRIGKPRTSQEPGEGWGMTATGAEYEDAGSASRFFKQVQEEDMDEIPQELWDYLNTLISPPPECEPVVIVESDLDAVDFQHFPDESVHGIITVGNPDKHLAEIDRVLRPGAHLLLISGDDEPTGHSGACAVEEFGYEIRDAIAVLDTPGEFHYVAKAPSAERNAGIELKENTTGRLVQNDHPTVKAVGVMEALLMDVPKDGVVIDPFMGSGTTGIACRRTGHDFIGIEQDEEYIKIADQRIHYWDRAFAAWNGADIESEAKLDEDEEPVSLGGFFGIAEEDDEGSVGGCPVCEERDEEIEIKELGKRLEVCSECCENRERVREFLKAHPEWH